MEEICSVNIETVKSHSGRRIAFVYNEPFDPLCGGIQRVTDNITKCLKLKGFSIYYYSLQPASEGTKLAASQHTAPSKDIRSQDVIDDYHTFLRENQIDTVIIQGGQFWGFPFYMQTGNPKIRRLVFIHSEPLRHYKHLWWVTICQNSRRGIRGWISCIHHYWREKRRMRKSWRNHYAPLANSDAEIYLLSDRHRYDFSLAGYDFSSRCRTLPNPNTYSDPVNVDFSEKEKEVLFVGRMIDMPKQISILLKIWDIVAPQAPDWRLTLVGGGPDEHRLRELAANMNLPRIQFEGRVDPTPYYRRASILCLTSVFEGFPMVSTEAQQNGVTVIAFDSFASARDIFDNEKSGVLVPPFRIKEYAKKLLNLIQDDSYRLTLANNARLSVQRYSLEKVVNRWVNYLITPMRIQG